MEVYLTIEELAVYLKLAEQTIRRWVMKEEIPFHRIKSVIRFRLSEIETWVSKGFANKTGVECDVTNIGCSDGDLFSDEKVKINEGNND